MPRGRVRVLRGGIGGKLNCDFFVLSVPAAVGHCFMSILTHPKTDRSRWYARGGGPVEKVNNLFTAVVLDTS